MLVLAGVQVQDVEAAFTAGRRVLDGDPAHCCRVAQDARAFRKEAEVLSVGSEEGRGCELVGGQV